MDLNSDSTDDLATTFYILLLYFSKFPLRKVQYPVVDLLSRKPA